MRFEKQHFSMIVLNCYLYGKGTNALCRSSFRGESLIKVGPQESTSYLREEHIRINMNSFSSPFTCKSRYYTRAGGAESERNHTPFLSTFCIAVYLFMDNILMLIMQT